MLVSFSTEALDVIFDQFADPPLCLCICVSLHVQVNRQQYDFGRSSDVHLSIIASPKKMLEIIMRKLNVFSEDASFYSQLCPPKHSLVSPTLWCFAFHPKYKTKVQTIVQRPVLWVVVLVSPGVAVWNWKCTTCILGSHRNIYVRCSKSC